MKNTKKIPQSDLQNWINFVHCGDCCGMKDPIEDARNAYTKEILSKPKKSSQGAKHKLAA